MQKYHSLYELKFSNHSHIKKPLNPRTVRIINYNTTNTKTYLHHLSACSSTTNQVIFPSSNTAVCEKNQQHRWTGLHENIMLHADSHAQFTGWLVNIVDSHQSQISNAVLSSRWKRINTLFQRFSFDNDDNI